MTVAHGVVVLRRTLALALVLAGGCSSDDNSTGDCAVSHETKTITTPEPAENPGLQFKIESCRADIDACPALCALAMTQAGINFNQGGGFAEPGIPTDSNGAPISSVAPAVDCDVTFRDGNVSMKVKYDVYNSTVGCPIFVNDGSQGGVAPTTGTGGPK